MLSSAHKLNDFIVARNDFSFKTFGPPETRGPICPLTHLKDEVQELIDNINDPMEWADCFLLLLDAAARAGHSVDDLIDFGAAKLEINKLRKWELQDNGVYKHIEE